MRKRNRIFPFLRIVPVLLASLPSASASTIELNLMEALQRAPKANFQILLAAEAVTTQAEAVRTTRSALYPGVVAEAFQSRVMAPNIDPFSRSFPGIPQRFFVDRFDAVLRARLSLLDTRSRDDLRLSKLDLQATEWQLLNVEQDILGQIAAAYFNHWRNQQRLTVIDQTLERDQILLSIAVDQQEAGVATALDVTRAEVGLAGNELVRLQQETTLMQSGLDLKRALNLNLEAELLLTVESPVEMGLGDPDDLDSLLEDVLAQRADYQQVLAQLEREILARNAIRRERLPSVELSGQWGYASPRWSDDLDEQWGVQLGVSVPVFEGFRIDSQRRAAESLIRRKELELADLKARIEAEFLLVIQQVKSTRQQMAVAAKARDLNAREYQLERIRFEQGVADNSDVVDSQTQLADAEDALVDAQYQFILAQINLARVRGDVMSLVR